MFQKGPNPGDRAQLARLRGSLGCITSDHRGSGFFAALTLGARKGVIMTPSSPRRVRKVRHNYRVRLFKPIDRAKFDRVVWPDFRIVLGPAAAPLEERNGAV